MKTKRKFRVGRKVRFIRGKKDSSMHIVSSTFIGDVPRLFIDNDNHAYPEDYFEKFSRLKGD